MTSTRLTTNPQPPLLTQRPLAPTLCPRTEPRPREKTDMRWRQIAPLADQKSHVRVPRLTIA